MSHRPIALIMRSLCSALKVETTACPRIPDLQRANAASALQAQQWAWCSTEVTVAPCALCRGYGVLNDFSVCRLLQPLLHWRSHDCGSGGAEKTRGTTLLNLWRSCHARATDAKLTMASESLRGTHRVSAPRFLLAVPRFLSARRALTCLSRLARNSK